MKPNQITKSFLLLLCIACLFASCKKDEIDNETRIDAYEFKWTGINDVSFNGTDNYSSFLLKVTMHDPEGRLNAGSTWVETVGSQSPNSFGLSKPVNKVFTVTGILGYGGPSSTNTIIPYREYIRLNNGDKTNEIKFDAIRQPGAN